MVKMLGVEWKLFYSDESVWVGGAWHEEEQITVNGDDISPDLDLSSVDDCDIITLSAGVFYHTEEVTEDAGSLESEFKKWRRKQTRVSMLIDVPKERVDELKIALSSFGGKVLKNG